MNGSSVPIGDIGVRLFDHLIGALNTSSVPYRHRSVSNVLSVPLYRLDRRAWNTTVRAEHTTVARLGF